MPYWLSDPQILWVMVQADGSWESSKDYVVTVCIGVNRFIEINQNGRKPCYKTTNKVFNYEITYGLTQISNTSELHVT